MAIILPGAELKYLNPKEILMPAASPADRQVLVASGDGGCVTAQTRRSFLLRFANMVMAR
jgi:hypothetical protein